MEQKKYHTTANLVENKVIETNDEESLDFEKEKRKSKLFEEINLIRFIKQNSFGMTLMQILKQE